MQNVRGKDNVRSVVCTLKTTDQTLMQFLRAMNRTELGTTDL